MIRVQKPKHRPKAVLKSKPKAILWKKSKIKDQHKRLINLLPTIKQLLNSKRQQGRCLTRRRQLSYHWILRAQAPIH